VNQNTLWPGVTQMEAEYFSEKLAEVLKCAELHKIFGYYF
jgi:hypothetical protein